MIGKSSLLLSELCRHFIWVLLGSSTHILPKSQFEMFEEVSDGWHQTMLRDIEMNFFIITQQKLCGNFRSRSRFMLRFPNDSITLRIISTNESRLQHSFNLCSKRHSLLHLLVNFKTEDKEKTGTRTSSFSRSNVFFVSFLLQITGYSLSFFRSHQVKKINWFLSHAMLKD